MAFIKVAPLSESLSRFVRINTNSIVAYWGTAEGTRIILDKDAASSIGAVWSVGGATWIDVLDMVDEIDSALETLGLFTEA